MRFDPYRIDQFFSRHMPGMFKAFSIFKSLICVGREEGFSHNHPPSLRGSSARECRKKREKKKTSEDAYQEKELEKSPVEILVALWIIPINHCALFFLSASSGSPQGFFDSFRSHGKLKEAHADGVIDSIRDESSHHNDRGLAASLRIGRLVVENYGLDLRQP